MKSYSINYAYDTDVLSSYTSARKALRRYLPEADRAGERRSRSDLDFFTHSALSALLPMQESMKQEQR